jgi:hypothetical protein
MYTSTSQNWELSYNTLLLLIHRILRARACLPLALHESLLANEKDAKRIQSEVQLIHRHLPRKDVLAAFGLLLQRQNNLSMLEFFISNHGNSVELTPYICEMSNLVKTMRCITYLPAQMLEDWNIVYVSEAVSRAERHDH